MMLLCIVFVSCHAPKKLFKGHYKIVNYILHPEADSLLNLYLSQHTTKSQVKNMYIEFGAFQDHNYGLKNSQYYVVLYERNDSAKRGKPKHINESKIDFLVSNTNRYAVINKGKYIIPMIFDFDTLFFKREENNSSTYPDTVRYRKLLKFEIKEWAPHNVEWIVPCK